MRNSRSTILMKHYIHILLVLLVGNVQLISQTNKLTDTLFIFNKKYALSRTSNYFTNVSNFPYSIFTAQYQTASKTLKYQTIKSENCVSSSSFNEYGNEITSIACSSNEKNDSYLHRFIDSIKINPKDFNPIAIGIKRKSNIIKVDKIQYIAVFDSSSFTIQVDGSDGRERQIINEFFNKPSSPKFIVINTLFYSDDKNRISYYLPCEFIIIPVYAETGKKN